MSGYKPQYVFTFKAKRRKRPNQRYNGILRSHRFYISYFSLLNSQDPIEVTSNKINEPKIEFPIRFMETLLRFAKDLGGKVLEVQRVKPPKSESHYEKPFVLLPNELAFRRHLLFALTASTYRKPGKLNTLKNLILNLNANFLNVLSSIALDRYFQFKNASNPSLYWYMYRVGRAIKVLYNLDR